MSTRKAKPIRITSVRLSGVLLYFRFPLVVSLMKAI